jgi:hypothetical protein
MQFHFFFVFYKICRVQISKLKNLNSPTFNNTIVRRFHNDFNDFIVEIPAAENLNNDIHYGEEFLYKRPKNYDNTFDEQVSINFIE